MVADTASGIEVPPRDGSPRRLRPFKRWPRAADATLAVVVFLLEVLGNLGQATNEPGELDLSTLGDLAPAAFVLLAVSSVALLWRRRHPITVMLATLAALPAWDSLELPGGPSLAILISLYGVGRYITDDRTSLRTVAFALVIVIFDDVIERDPASVFLLSMALVLLAWYFGRGIRSRARYLILLEERAEFLERERVATAQRAVDEERNRIARELHDIVAHRVSMITVQAGAAQAVVASHPDKALRAMEAVEGAGREALTELRHVLGVLRSDGEPEALGPVRGLDDIDGLVAQSEEAGMHVSLFREGLPAEVSTQVGLAAYRIVQEALTNVLKHAGPNAPVDVRLVGNDDVLTIEVTDRGSGTTQLPGAGQGLVGMRERATLVGGSFEAGPQPEGGFRVSVRLPLESGSHEDGAT